MAKWGLSANVNGLPLAMCLDRLAAVFCRYGSASLQVELMRLRPSLPAIGGFSLRDAIAALDDLSPAADLSWRGLESGDAG